MCVFLFGDMASTWTLTLAMAMALTLVDLDHNDVGVDVGRWRRRWLYVFPSQFMPTTDINECINIFVLF